MKCNSIPSRLIGLLLLAITASPAPGQQKPTDAVRLSVEISNHEIVPYEPVFAWAVLRNESKEVATLPYHRRLWMGLEIWMAKKGEQLWLAYPALRAIPSVGGRDMRLEPGQASARRMPLLFLGKNKQFLFPEPGVYQIKAVLRNVGKEPLESKVVEVTVKAGTQKDAGAARLISQDLPALMLQGWSSSPAAAKVLEQIVDDSPQTPHADFANHRLGTYYAIQFSITAQQGAKDEKLAAQAFRHLYAVSRRIPGLRADALLQAKTCFGSSPKLRPTVDLKALVEELAALQKDVPGIEMKQLIEKGVQYLRTFLK